MSFKIILQPSGHEFEIEKEETILEGALRHGYAFSYGCRAGACGACKGKVVSGRFHYEDDEDPISLSSQESKAGMCVFCQAYPASDMELEIKEITSSKQIDIKVLPTRVSKMEKLAPDVMRLYLKLPMVERLQFLAGQYIDILLKDGRRRSFSIANAPHDDEFLELHIRKVEGGEFTSHVFEKMKEKDLMRIEGPLGTFHLNEESEKPILFIAGGTGFAPIKGMLEHAFAEETTRPMILYWGVRNIESLYLAELPEKWMAEHDNFKFVPVLSDPAVSDEWGGREGFVHEAVLADFNSLSEFEIYASGPPAMINEVRDTFSEKGFDKDSFYFDSFEFSKD